LLIAVVLHAIGYVGSLREPRFFDLWVTRLRTCPRIRNFAFWGGNSYQP
jgi:type IV secretion system protein VirB3